MYRVLLVDDEALIREAVGENVCWSELGYELAASCENGKEAMEFIRADRVDLVLTDICMPYMDGLGLCECLFHEYPDIEVVILSGYDDFDYAKRALSYNVNEYLLKPVTASELSETLLSMKEKLDKKRQREELMDRMSTAYHKSRLLVRSSALLGVIKGSRTPQENQKELEDASICLGGAYYCVAELEACLREDQQKESALMSFVIGNVAGEIVSRRGAGEVCRDNDLRTLILFETNKPREFRGLMQEILAEIKEALINLMGLCITAGIGRYVQELEDIPLSYRDAEEALGYRYILGDGEIIDLTRMEGGTEWTSREQDIAELMMQIKKNDPERIRERLFLCGQRMREAAFIKNRACLCMQDILVRTRELLKSSSLGDGGVYQRGEQVLSQVAAAVSLEQALALLEKYCREAAAAMDGRKNSGGRKYAMMAMDFIEKNYGDSGMNLNSVCSYLNISTSRFSSTFKSATGETFMEAVNRIRMEKAKELLENTDLKGYEIAERVGFSDPHYFSAVFKKMTGKTPTEYAKEKR